MICNAPSSPSTSHPSPEIPSRFANFGFSRLIQGYVLNNSIISVIRRESTILSSLDLKGGMMQIGGNPYHKAIDNLVNSISAFLLSLHHVTAHQNRKKNSRKQRGVAPPVTQTQK